MQVEPDDFILSLAPGDMEDDRQNIIPSEEQNNLPADLENTDMTELVILVYLLNLISNVARNIKH